MNTFKNSEVNVFGLRVWQGVVNTLYPPHRHNEIELNAIVEGYFTYSLAGQQITIAVGEVGLFWGAIPHQVIDFAPATRVYWGTVPLNHVLHWHLPAPFFHALLSGHLFKDAHPLYHREFFHRWEADLPAGHEALVLMELKALFFRFAMQEVAPQPHSEAVHGRANQMAAFISQHFAEPLTVGEIAAVVGLHPHYAMTIFKQTFGMTLIDYLTQQRIAYAQQRLILTDDNMSDVALESGFQTLSHFYTAFGRLCGLTPGKYRQSLRG